MSLTLERKYPLQYPADAVKVLNAMSFTNGKELMIVGSSSLRSQQYAGDYDAHEDVVVNYKTREAALSALARQFKVIIMKLMSFKNVFIGDIKSGSVDEWDVLKYPSHIKDLQRKKIITSEEASKAERLIKDNTPIGKLKAKQELKFHIVRWTTKQVLAGKQTLVDGHTFTLEEAFGSPTITKLDVVALIQEKYSELSVIYEFINGSKVLNKSDMDIEQSLRDAIILYDAEGNRFKAVKRKFALAKLKDNKDEMEKYSAIINSEAGKLYVVYTDVKVLADLLESHSVSNLKLEDAIDGFRHRLSRIYQDDAYLRKEPELLDDLAKATKSKNPLPILRHTEAELFKLLNKQTAVRGGYIPYSQG